MFTKINSNYFLHAPFQQVYDAAVKAALCTDEESFRALLDLPGAVGADANTSAEACFNEVQRWAGLYLADQGSTAIAPVLPFLTGGEYNDATLKGFIPTCTAVRESLIDFASENTVSLFGAAAFGEGVERAEAVATVREFIATDETQLLLAAGIDGSKDSVDVLADGLGITLPEITSEDLQIDEPAATPAVEPAEEPAHVDAAEPVETEVVATDEPAIQVVEEVVTISDLPVIQEPSNLPAAHVLVPKGAVAAFVQGQHTIAAGLAAMADGLKQNADAFGQMLLGDQIPVTASEEVVEEQTV